MTEKNERRLPVGLQSFTEIRRKKYLYVDKTDIIWNLANKNKKYNYLSRPRRFGKSVLVDTLQAYFEGRRELFEGKDNAVGERLGESSRRTFRYESWRS